MADEKSKTPADTEGAKLPANSGEDIDQFLATVRSMPPVEHKGSGRGRLIFAMDATMSRQPTWDTALQIQAEMFQETGRIGGLDVQLVYFRGFRESQSSKWVNDPESLARLMTQVDCRGGNTQIARVLKHIRREKGKGGVNAVVYVGDAMEENVDKLCQIAGEIGLLGVPMFMFQEGHDSIAEQAFREIARLTRGAYCRFDRSSARQLRELLSAVAVYAAGGRQALADYAGKSGQGRLLLEQMK